MSKKTFAAKQTSRNRNGISKSLKPKRNKKSKTTITESKRKNEKEDQQKTETTIKSDAICKIEIESASTAQQLSFFLREFQSASNVRLSSMELQAINGFEFGKLKTGEKVKVSGFDVVAIFLWSGILLKSTLKATLKWFTNNCIGRSMPVKAKRAYLTTTIYFIWKGFAALGGLWWLPAWDRRWPTMTDNCIFELPEGAYKNVDIIWKPIKAAFGQMEELVGNQLVEGKAEPGSPCVLVVCASALKSVDLLRGFKPLTKECPAAKIFSKHMKIDEQVSLLKKRVNIACGTPNRIKKLIEMEALGISRLSVLVLDLRKDAKCYTLLTLPQVRDDFWDLYRTYLHKKLVEGAIRICLYGPVPSI